MKALTISPFKALCFAIFLCFSYTSVQAASTKLHVTVNFLGKDYTKSIDYSKLASVTAVHASLINKIKNNSPLLAVNIVKDEVNRVLNKRAVKLAKSSKHLRLTSVLFNEELFPIVFNFQDADEIKELAMELSKLNMSTATIQRVLEQGDVPAKVASSVVDEVANLRNVTISAVLENITDITTDIATAYDETINEQQNKTTASPSN